MVLYSSPVTVIRYTNGTMVRLTASAREFVSYDYNPDTQSGSFLPQTITVTATVSGHLTLKEWQYLDSEGYRKIEDIQGVTISGNVLTIVPGSKLFENSNSVTIRALGSDDTHDDTVTISKIVDPMYVYDRTHTSIEQTNDKIALIASEEQLAQLSESETFIDKYSAFVQTASGFQQTVQTTYATKNYADSSASTAASGAVTTANAYADGKLQDYPTKLEVSSAIEQTATGITQTVSENYSTKEQTLITAKNEAGNAQTGAQDYTDLQLRNYLTTSETQSRIDQKAGEITQTVEATYATKEELTSATDGTYTLETPYFYEDQTYSFEAKIYKNSEDITESLPEDHIMWSVRSEEYFDEEVIGTGRTATIHEDKIGYGGTVVCHMVVTSEEFPLTTEEDYNLTDEYGQALTIVYALSELTTETTLYRKDYLKNQFAQLRVTMDGITAEVRSQESKFGQALTEQWSRTVQRAEGIETEVGRKVGTDEIISRINQSPEEVSIQAGKINLQGAVTADCIATGAVTADKIDVEDLFAQDIEATGTITGATLVGTQIQGGAISGTSINTQEGNIGGWEISEDGLSSEDGSMTLNPNETSPHAAKVILGGLVVDGAGRTSVTDLYCDGGIYFPFTDSELPVVGGYTEVSQYIQDLGETASDHEDRIYDLEHADLPAIASFTSLTVTGNGNALTVTHGISCTEINASGHIETLNSNIKGGEVYTMTNTHGTGDNAVITSSGRIAPASSSSKRYKDGRGDVQPNDARRVLDIPVVKFAYKEGYLDKDDEMVGVTMPGFYAEDVEKYIPEAVYHKNGKVENWSERIILPLLLKVVQEQQKEIDELKTLVKEALNHAN